MAKDDFGSIPVSMDNKLWLEKQRQRIAKNTPYPRKVSLDEAFSALRKAYEQRQELNQKGKL